MVTKTEPDKMSASSPGGDQVESLDAIARQGAALEVTATHGAPGAPGTPANPAEKAEIAAALVLLRESAMPFAPEHVQPALRQVWGDPQMEQIADAIVQICRLHGWTTGDFFGKYGPYIQLAMALGIPALATLKLLKMPPPPKAAADGQQQ